MKTILFRKLSVLSLACFAGTLYAHEHMPAGATANTPGATLEYAPGAEEFTTNSGFVFNLTAGMTNDPYFGYFYTSDQVFEGLPATPDDGGPDPDAAAP